MFLIKDSLQTYRQKNPGAATYDASQGDGGASLPGVPHEILERAAAMQVEHGTAYDNPGGTPAFRKAVVEAYWKLDGDLGIGPANVIATVGGRDALIKAYEAMLALGHGHAGDFIVVSRVPWISYNWGPYGIGGNVMLAPGREDEAWAYTEDGLRECVAFARRSGREVAGVVITSPDNPTGRTLTTARQAALARAALEAGVAFVLFDWIYHHVTDESPTDLNELLRWFTPEERRRLIVLDGITKSLGASSIRSAHLIASDEVIRFIVARASHGVFPGFYSTAVATAAYEAGLAEAARGIVEPTNASRVVLREFLDARNMRYILGQGYYAFLHVGDVLRRTGWSSTEPLAEYIALEHGLAVVPGAFNSPFGNDWIRFSYALPPETTRAAANRLIEALGAVDADADAAGVGEA